MGTQVRIDVFGKELADTRTILRPVCVVTHSYIVLGTDVRGESHQQKNDESSHDSSDSSRNKCRSNVAGDISERCFIGTFALRFKPAILARCTGSLRSANPKLAQCLFRENSLSFNSRVNSLVVYLYVPVERQTVV